MDTLGHDAPSLSGALNSLPYNMIVVLRVDLLSVNVGDKTVLQPVLHNSVRCRNS